MTARVAQAQSDQKEKDPENKRGFVLFTPNFPPPGAYHIVSNLNISRLWRIETSSWKKVSILLSHPTLLKVLAPTQVLPGSLSCTVP